MCIGCGPLGGYRERRWRPSLRVLLRDVLLVGYRWFGVLVLGGLECGPLVLFYCRILRSFGCCCASDVGVSMVISL